MLETRRDRLALTQTRCETTDEHTAENEDSTGMLHRLENQRYNVLIVIPKEAQTYPHERTRVLVDSSLNTGMKAHFPVRF